MILVHRDFVCSGSALGGRSGEEDLFTSLGEQAPHLPSAQQHKAEAQRRGDNQPSIYRLEQGCPVNILSANVLIEIPSVA